MKRKETNIFLEIEDTPKTRILDFLLTFDNFDYPKTQIAKNSVERMLPSLVKLGLVKKTRKVGKSELYQINKDNPIALLLIKLHWTLIKTITRLEQGIAITKPIEIKIPVKVTH